MTVHVIPVPHHMTVEEAWDEIRLLGALLSENQPKSDKDCQWAVITTPSERNGG